MSDEFRVFHALRTGAPPQEAAALKLQIQSAVQRSAPELNVVVTSAEEDFAANMARLGGWDAWETNVATGVRYTDRQPLFHAVVLTDIEFGKATASIVRQALAAHKLVMFIEPQTYDLSRVGQVVTIDDSNWKTGWAASLL